MSKAKIKGCHDIRTLQARSDLTRAGSRQQVIAKLARLEHQKSLLQRQLKVWRQQQQKTEHRLGLVERQIAEAQAAASGAGRRPSAATAPRARGRPRALNLQY